MLVKSSRFRILGCIMALVVVVSLMVSMVSCGESEPETTEPTTLVFACFEPDRGLMYDKFWKPWLDEVEKRTGGMVKIEAHFNGELAAPPDAWDDGGEAGPAESEADRTPA